MKSNNLFSSLGILIIGLITPFLVWILLYVIAHMKPQSFDPNPQVQELLTSPQVFQRGEGPHPWYFLYGKNGEWSVKNKEGALTPLAQWKPESKTTVLFLEAQGPTLAMELYHFLKDRELIDKVIVISASDGLLKDLRFHDPKFTESAGQAYMIRFEILKRLSLEGLITIDVSVAYLDPKILGAALPAMAEHFLSMHVPVFVPADAKLEGTELSKKVNILLE